jgi:hypothetical protein
VGVKRQGREADHLPPTSAEVKKALSYTSPPQYVFIAWCSVEKQRDNFLFYCGTTKHSLCLKTEIRNWILTTFPAGLLGNGNVIYLTGSGFVCLNVVCAIQ